MFAAPPIMNLTVIRSPDIDRSARFYAAMGLVFTKHRHGSGPEHYTSIVDGFVFEVYPIGSGLRTDGTRIGFSVDDVDSIVELLADAGGIVVTHPHDTEWGRRAVVKDPDGHPVELVTPPKRDVIVAMSGTSTGVITQTHTQGMNPGDFDRGG
ncbi:MAG: Glyoxalase/bleomycin resistance protein/dioxygenase [Planctomycetaceae bacterium]|nr:Glyoxalase/bleomycin resistance protein/dioxygenase [Planctomycetaceae bacterium]